MTGKITYYETLAEETARRLASSRQEWKAFLSTSARNYLYPFEDQLMIYAQRPEATACAEYDLWNKVMRRYVKRGSKGIALLCTSGTYPKLRYVFDVADTGERENSREVKLWSIKSEQREYVTGALKDRFGADGNYLEAVIESISRERAVEFWEENKRDFIDIVGDSFLSGYDEDTLKVRFTEALSASVKFTLLERCTENPADFCEEEDFTVLSEFSTPATITALGTANAKITKEVFSEISRAITEIEKQKERSSHDRVKLPESRGLFRTGDRDTADTRAARQMGNDEERLSERGETSPVLESHHEGDSLRASAGDPGERQDAAGADDGRIVTKIAGTGQGEGSDGLGSPHESAEEPGGGSDRDGAYHQLDLFSMFPSEQEQIERIDRTGTEDTEITQAEEKESSAFSMPEGKAASSEKFSDEEWDRILQNGSGFVDGKSRIQRLFETEKDGGKRADAIKQEYGIGGRSWTFLDGTNGSIDYDSRGITAEKYGSDQKQRLSWSEVEKRLERLIETGRYLENDQDIVEPEVEQDRLDEFQVPESESIVPETNEVTESALAEQDNLAEPEITVDPGIYTDLGHPIDSEIGTETVAITENATEIPTENYRITDPHLGEGSPKTKYQRNVAAIKLLKALEDENRNATPEEQEILSQYVGWGGLSDAFDERKTEWSSEYKELKFLLTDEEYEAARASTLNAHYTSPVVISSIYDALAQMGFTGGNVLEPSMGVGNFFGMLPESMRSSRLYGVELDPVSGCIAKKLYPKAQITVGGFETTSRRDFYDVAVGNVPFGNYKVSDKPYDYLGFSIHNYFFAKAMDQVRPGGVVAFVTSRFTMDQKSPEVRKYLAQRAELLGAIRLPNNAFKANAGTDVVSDIIFLKKRERPIDIEPDWVHLGLTEEGLTINSYFTEHPEMVLGEIASESTQYGKDALTVAPIPGTDLKELLKEAVGNIRGEIAPPEEVLQEEADSRNTIPADPDVKNFSFTVVDDKVYYRENSVMTECELSVNDTERIRQMVGIRQIMNNLIDMQLEDYSESAIKEMQERLNSTYDSFTARFGLINSRANARAFEDDSSYYLLCSLENLNEDGTLKSKADMFTKRTIRPEKNVTSVETPAEALEVSIGEKGGVDLDFMSELLGTPGDYDRIESELKGVIFRDPVEAGGDAKSGWETADSYLSGDVRTKLKTALYAAESNPEYQVNVDALKKAMPKDLDASEIDVRLGATWIDAKYINDFMYETFNTPYYLQRSIEVNYSAFTAEWQIKGKSVPSYSDVNCYVTYGTGRANAYRILEDTLNLKDVRIYDYTEDAEGKKIRVLNKQETTLAQQKQQMIKDAFADWVWKDPERRAALTKKYNELFNSTRPREYDGAHINFAGMNPDIRLREHQKNAIAHVLYGGNTLLAHEVGAGKTFEMTAAAMESKRLGLCHKSMFVVPNHLTLQWATEFLRLYPSAKLLVAGRKDFEKKKRRKFCARIATGDYDAVIIGHSQFERIPISKERQQRMISEQIEEIENGIAELKHNRGDSFTIKQMEKTRKSLKVRLEKLNNEEKKDDVINFEELGVDRLFVDESQAFKNLFLYTKMRNVAGLSATEAQKSSDMFLKCRYMDEITGGRGVVFATGTPVSNSMTELYTLMRYLQYSTLQKMGLTHFDCWASTFGETTTAIELAPEGTGYRARTRFAKFFNLPELMNMFREVADIKTADTLNLPVPEAEFINVMAKPTEIQKEMVQSLSERAAIVHNKAVDPSVDNMLKITSDGRKIGLDQRLMNPELSDDPGSKVNLCIENVMKIWQEGKEEKRTQLIFCDMSTPKNDGTFNVYDDLKKKLIAQGVPESEIAFIHDADTEAKKKELFGKVRTGQVRVLMGSTQKMGAGTNVQDRLIAVHHLDVGWRPSDMTQRNGRIIRQGNQNKKVQIYNYVTEGTFDAYLWQTLENKQRFISQIMTSKSPVRSCEDVDEQALSYAEVKALCAGNPLIKEKMDLDIEVARLKVLKADHKSQQFRLEDKVLKEFPDLIANTKERISAMQEDVNTLAAHPLPEDGFIGMTVAGKNYTEKADAGKAILEACKQYKGGDKTSLGEYRGLAMQLSYDSFNNEHVITFKGASKHHVALGSDARGNITRIDNALAGISEKIAESEQKLEALQMQMANASAELGKPFPQEKELQEKTARLAELDALLNMDESSQQDDRTQENASETISDSKPSILSSLRETHVSEAHRPQESRQYLRVGEAR